MYEVLLVLLKFLSIASAAVFGIIGLLHDFKNDNGQITKWGRISLIGIIVSALIAGATETFTLVKTQEESRAEAKRREELLKRIDVTTTKSDQVLQEVSRGVHPIDGLKISFEAELPLESIDLKPTRVRLCKEAEAFLNLSPDQQSREKRAFVITALLGDSPYTLEVQPGNPALPGPERPAERAAWDLLSNAGVKMEFYNPPISSGKYPATSGIAAQSPGAALTVWVGNQAPLLDAKAKGQFRLLYDPKPERLYYSAIGVPVPEQHMILTGQMIGIPDLLGGQMFVRFYNGQVPTGPAQVDPKLANDVTIKAVGLAFKGARQFWLSDDQLIRHSNEQGLSYHVFQFPADLPTLFKNSREVFEKGVRAVPPWRE